MFCRLDLARPVLIAWHLTGYGRFLPWIQRNRSLLAIFTSRSSTSTNLCSSTRCVAGRPATRGTRLASSLSMIGGTPGFGPSTLPNARYCAYQLSCWRVVVWSWACFELAACLGICLVRWTVYYWRREECVVWSMVVDMSLCCRWRAGSMVWVVGWTCFLLFKWWLYNAGDGYNK